MLTKSERELVNYWKDWKPGMGVYKGNNYDEPKEVKVEVVVPDLKYLAEDIGDEIWDII